MHHAAYPTKTHPSTFYAIIITQFERLKAKIPYNIPVLVLLSTLFISFPCFVQEAAGQAMLSIADVTVKENAGNALFTLLLKEEVPGGFQVKYTTEDNTAVAPDDYTGLTGQLLFSGSKGETHTISIPINNDDIQEATESFFVKLLGTSNAAVTFDKMAIGTILDNDSVQIVARDDQFTTDIDNPVSGNLLDNDSGESDETLTVSEFSVGGQVYAVGQKAVLDHMGSVSVAENGAFTFVPYPNYNGPMLPLAYTITDDEGGSSSAYLYIDVVPANNPPLAEDDAYTGMENMGVSGNLLDNDVAQDNTSMTLLTTPVSAPSHGRLVLNSDGTFTYKPVGGFIGIDSFVYEVSNNNLDRKYAMAKVVITIDQDPNQVVFVPNSFSPNGDGIHDVFKVASIRSFSNPVMEIYSRSGKLVFHKEHYGDVGFWGDEQDAWWDGHASANGQVTSEVLPVGTYYYVLKLLDTKAITGFLFLNR